MVIPIAAPNCKYDWNYNYHGQNWVCNCNEGLEQSPIDLPLNSLIDNVKYVILLLDLMLSLVIKMSPHQI